MRLAPNVGVLIIARAVAGAGAAATTTGGSAVLVQAYRGQARRRAFAVFGTAIGVGLAFGPLVAGFLVTSLGGWRMFFLVATLVLTPVLAAMVAGPELGWTAVPVALALMLFVVFIVAFGVVEMRRDHPMIELSLLRSARFAAICAVPFLLAFGSVSLLIILPPYFSAVDGYSAQQSGLVLLLLTGPMLLPVVVTRCAPRVPEPALFTATIVVVAVGCAWLTVLQPGVSIGAITGPLLVIGTGVRRTQYRTPHRPSARHRCIGRAARRSHSCPSFRSYRW